MQNNCVKETYTIKETIACFESENDRVAVVLNEDKKVVGVVSQGDILRALSSGADLYTQINHIISNSFLHLYERDLEMAFKIFKTSKITLLPIINEENELVDCITLKDIYEYLEKKSNN